MQDTETFDYSDIQDHDTYKNVNGSISGSIGIGGDDGTDNASPDLLDQIAALPTIEGSYEASEKEQITRATVAAPNGDATITIRANPGQGVDGLNNALEKAQEVTKDKKTKVKVYVDGAALREVASGFEGTRGALTELAKAVDNALNPVKIAIIEDQQGLQDNLENQTALLKQQGLSNREINEIINSTEFQGIIVDVMAAEDVLLMSSDDLNLTYGASGFVHPKDIEEVSKTHEIIYKEDGSAWIKTDPPSREEIFAHSLANTGYKVKEYFNKLPQEESMAVMLALQTAVGGPFKTALSLAANSAIDSIAGDDIEEFKKEASVNILAALLKSSPDVIRDTSLLDFDISNEVKQKLEGTEFLVFTVLAGTINLKGGNSALSKINNPIDLTGHRRTHILNGHFHGVGTAGKTEFPSNWSADRIIHQVSDVATDPNATRGVGKWDSPYAISIRDGVEIRVDFYPNFKPNGQPHPNAGKISTAYPINVSANP